MYRTNRTPALPGRVVSFGEMLEDVDGPPGQRVPVRFAARTVWDLIARRATDTPDAVMAIDEQRRSLTFGRYEQRCQQVAAGLQALGVTAATHVAWQLPTCLDALVLFGALARLQAVQIPLVPLYRDREMSFVLRQTKASFVVVPGMWRGYDYTAMARRVAGGLTEPITTLITDHGLPEGDPASLASAALPSTQS